jgi:hypothetical protein
MMGGLMQRSFSELREPVQARAEAVVSFSICPMVGLVHVRAIAMAAPRMCAPCRC